MNKDDLIFDIIEHSYFQRLRRIKQLGLTHLVYPGALHTRFQHAIGTMHLMKQAIMMIRSKGHDITDKEENAALIAILLHEIGHGPFSHALENSIVENMNHEDLSALFMDRFNEIFNGKLSLALKIFRNQYHKKFLYQLVSGQLDVDRLDYLNRDSYYTGVVEGVISTDRIITMLNIHHDELIAEAKGIYSLEKFIVARRLMYWQVYYHKTVVSAEFMLIHILRRAKYLVEQEIDLFATPILLKFLKNRYTKSDFLNDPELLEDFSKLDDFDIFTSIKVWMNHSDKILSTLSRNIVNRQLNRIEFQSKAVDMQLLDDIKIECAAHCNLDVKDTSYFVYSGTIENFAYNPKHDKINIIYRDGSIVDISEASQQLNIAVLSESVSKHFICYPKGLGKY